VVVDVRPNSGSDLNVLVHRRDQKKQGIHDAIGDLVGR
jgi:hypothetical protein